MPLKNASLQIGLLLVLLGLSACMKLSLVGGGSSGGSSSSAHMKDFGNFNASILSPFAPHDGAGMASMGFSCSVYDESLNPVASASLRYDLADHPEQLPDVDNTNASGMCQAYPVIYGPNPLALLIHVGAAGYLPQTIPGTASVRVDQYNGYISNQNVNFQFYLSRVPYGPTQAAHIVKKIYADLYARTPSDDELATGIIYLTQNGLGPAGLTALLERSDEFFQKEIMDTYQRIVGHAPDAGSWAHWTDQLHGFHSSMELISALLASDEFYQLSGKTDEKYIQGIYQQALLRAASGNDVTFWTGKLPTMGRAQVVAAILSSEEAKKARIRLLYPQVLGRDADDGGVNLWYAQMSKVFSADPYLNVLAALEASQESINGPIRLVSGGSGGGSGGGGGTVAIPSPLTMVRYLPANDAMSMPAHILWIPDSGSSAVSSRLYRGACGQALPYPLLVNLDTPDGNYTDPDAATGTCYSYYVTLVNSAGESPKSNILTLNQTDGTSPVAAAPAPPARLGVVWSNPNRGLYLSWDDTYGPYSRSFNIYRASCGSSSFSLLATNQWRYPDMGIYEDRQAASTDCYSYYVTVVTSLGESAKSGIVTYGQSGGSGDSGGGSGGSGSSGGSVTSPPSTPSDAQLYTQSQASIEISWHASSGQPTAYSVQRAACEPCGCSTAKTSYVTVDPSQTTFTDGSVKPGSCYTYSVAAVNSAGMSSYSSEIQAKTPAPPPVVQKPAPPTCSLAAANQPNNTVFDVHTAYFTLTTAGTVDTRQVVQSSASGQTILPALSGNLYGAYVGGDSIVVKATVTNAGGSGECQTSVDYKKNLVRNAMYSFLGRGPSDADYSYFAPFSDAMILTAISASQESFQYFGGANAWVTGLYHLMLGRNAGASEIGFWASQPNRTLTVQSFLCSPEYRLSDAKGTLGGLSCP